VLPQISSGGSNSGHIRALPTEPLAGDVVHAVNGHAISDANQASARIPAGAERVVQAQCAGPERSFASRSLLHTSPPFLAPLQIGTLLQKLSGQIRLSLSREGAEPIDGKVTAWEAGSSPANHDASRARKSGNNPMVKSFGMEREVDRPSSSSSGPGSRPDSERQSTLISGDL